MFWAFCLLNFPPNDVNEANKQAILWTVNVPIHTYSTDPQSESNILEGKLYLYNRVCGTQKVRLCSLSILTPNRNRISHVFFIGLDPFGNKESIFNDWTTFLVVFAHLLLLLLLFPFLYIIVFCFRSFGYVTFSPVHIDDFNTLLYYLWCRVLFFIVTFLYFNVKLFRILMNC